MIKIKDIDTLRAFALVYQERSFTKAGLRLQISKAAVAKKISHLEDTLKIRLFLRSTRKVTPTLDGDSFYHYTLRVLDSVRELENSTLAKEDMQGVIRLTCVPAMASRFISKILSDFLNHNPNISIELIVTDSLLDLIDNNIDIAVRIGRLTPSSLTGKKIGVNQLVACAAPSYLRLHSKKLKKAQDLANHHLLFLDTHRDAKFEKSKLELKELAKYRRFICNDSLTLNSMGLNGNGILIRSKWDIKEYLDRNELIELFKDDPLTTFGDIWMLAPAGRLQAKRVRALFDFLEKSAKKYLN